MKNPLWGGRFCLPSSEIMKQINSSISFDKELYKEDIQSSIVHCQMLMKQKIIEEGEGKEIIKGLRQISCQINDGKCEFREDLEDIHMNIEYNLQKIIGDVAGKLHTARSRNDQVVTDLKIWVRNSICLLKEKLYSLQRAIVNIVEQHYDTIMPGFTHLQVAQPVTFGHHMMAYFEMLKRDILRFNSLYDRMNECPLGSAALAGTCFAIDRHFTAQQLGFEKPTENSIDSVSDRDYVIEFLSNASICIMHLSRLAEELILWCSNGMKFVELSDDMTTGSSIMPQKRNPDAAELIRGKAARVFSSLNQLLVVMKGLPLAYSKDMQEDKEPIFDVNKNLSLCIDSMKQMLVSMVINKENMYIAAGCDYSTATDLANWLVKNLNLSFRKSHEITGKIVKLAEEKKCRLCDLTLSQLRSIYHDVKDDIFLVLSVKNSVISKNSYGGTAPSRVLEAVKRARAFLDCYVTEKEN